MEAANILTVLLCAVVIIFLVIAVLNYWLDYYGMLRGERSGRTKYRSLRERYVKMKFLLTKEHWKRYDTFIFGCSRVQKMDPGVVSLKAYNLGDSYSMPQDCLRQLQLLLAHGAQIRTVYLGIDDYSYYRGYEKKQQKFYDFLTKEDRLAYWKYWLRLLITPATISRAVREMYKSRVGKERRYDTFIETNGMLLMPARIELKIEKAPEAYIERMADAYRKPFTVEPESYEDVRRECLQTMSAIKEICDQHSIRLVVFFNPLYRLHYMLDNVEKMNAFKKELVQITPFYDFSGINYVTRNAYFWYESAHPRAFICDKMLDLVAGQQKITWLPDFGAWVTPENVEAFCAKALRDREAYDVEEAQWIPSEEERKILRKRLHY